MQQSKQRSKLDPCFASAANRRKANAANAAAAAAATNSGTSLQAWKLPAKHNKQKTCHPTILSHGMFHRHPSLSIEHFHFPSLSDSNPFPWLNENDGNRRRRERKDSVFLTSSSWDSVIDRHLCGSGGSCSGGGAGGVSFKPGMGRNCVQLNEEEDEDEVFDSQQHQRQQQQQQQHRQQLSGRKRDHRQSYRDPRWREAIAEAVRRDFDFEASRRSHLAGLRVAIEPPPTARRRLQRLLGNDSRYCVAGRPVASLCDQEFTRQLKSAMDRLADKDQLELEARLAEAERLRELRLI